MNIIRYILRRMVLSAFVVVGVTFLVFTVAQVVPSDPAALYAGPRPSAEQIAKARVELNLDAPLPTRFLTFASAMATGDFGVSYKSRRLILEDLKAYLPATLELAVFSTAIALLFGVPLGVMAAARQGRWFDRLASLSAIASVAMPTFFLAMLLQLIFSQWLGVMPLSGRTSREVGITDPVAQVTGFLLIDSLLAGRPAAFGNAMLHLILPALTLASYPAGVAMRLTRSAMIEILQRRHITAARALGLSQRRILFGHALPNAMGPALTVIGLSFAFALTGAVLVEIIFAWPGLGRYVSEAILAKDFPVIAAVTMVVTICYVVMNLIIDVAQALVDPRVALT
ncbi:ABC transporter permease [Xinfangfangia sp. CPCC 101601]|uniref:ABC transporter permease n=1 Tax=Pseudogemmobacter lacusdianii TaxID=3069608 RepID=A0ABU0VVV9_9RHOB|nr:ABC transporter permease [Xinfangfangia sp. CPCC 101601]MDQ2065889.1 ABC transporter permease [Xinfangfangia sp. CPCC 101601]